MHDTVQLRDCCKRDADIAPHFLGVFPADGLPSCLPDTCYFILNTDTSDKPGQHWVAGARIKGVSYYFDSYGITPSDWNEFWRPLNRFKRSAKDLQQDTSTIRGDACLNFLKHMASGRSYESFIAQFDENDDRGNDRMFRKFAHDRWPRILNATTHDLENAYDTDHLNKNGRRRPLNQLGGVTAAPRPLPVMEPLHSPLELTNSSGLVQINVARRRP